MASTSRLRAVWGQLTTAEVNASTRSGTVILPARGVTSGATLTLTSVVTNQYVDIDGHRFTAKTATSVADRQFDDDAGDSATATALALCINNPNYGVPNVTASASSNVVTLDWSSSAHPVPVTMSPSAATIVCAAATHPGTVFPGDKPIAVLDCWMRAIGGAATTSTAIALKTTAETTIVSNAVAQLGEGLVLRAGATGSTVTNLGATNTEGVGLKIAATVADCTVMTALDYCVLFTGSGGSVVRTAYHEAVPVASLNGAYVVVPGEAEFQYTVLDCWVRATGSFGNANVTVNDGTTTVATFTHAGMSTGAILRAGTATTGVGTNLLAALAVGTPIYATGDALEATATALDICVKYAVSSVM